MRVHDFVAIDSEGDAGDRGLQGVAFWYGDRGQYLTDRDAIVAELRRCADEGFWFCAHNAEYDVHVIFWQLGIPARIVSYNGRFHHAEWKFDPKRPALQVWDTLSLSYFQSLQSMGDAIGCPKLETPQSLLGGDPDRYRWRCERHGVGECVECYAVRDAEICWRIMDTYRRLLGDYGVTPRATLGSAAVALWQQLDHPGDVSIRSQRVDALARASYHGGRVEPFVYGNVRDLHTADVAGMYPAVMLSQPMPDMTCLDWCDGSSCYPEVIHWEGVSECSVYVPDMTVPPLPCVADGRLYFPVGRFRGVWCHVELRAAVARGAVIERWHRSVYSPRHVYPFTTYIGVLSELKTEYKRTRDARREQVKCLLNSLYGRLGLSGGQTMEVTWPASADDIRGDLSRLHPELIDGRLYLRRSTDLRKLSPLANVLWASTITAAARVRLLDLMDLQGSSLVYVDTDSIYSRDPINGLGSGAGQLEDTGRWDRALIIGPKLYRLESDHPCDAEIGDRCPRCKRRVERLSQNCRITRAKGVAKGVADEYLTHGEARFSHAVRTREAMRSGLTAGSWTEIVRTQRLVPAKRQVLDRDWSRVAGGWSATVPVVMEPWTPDDPPELI